MVSGWIAAYERLRDFGDAVFVTVEPAKLGTFEHPTYRYLTTFKNHINTAIDVGVDLQDAIHSPDQSPWQGLADFDALAGRNAHQIDWRVKRRHSSDGCLTDLLVSTGVVTLTC